MKAFLTDVMSWWKPIVSWSPVELMWAPSVSAQKCCAVVAAVSVTVTDIAEHAALTLCAAVPSMAQTSSSAVAVTCTVVPAEAPLYVADPALLSEAKATPSTSRFT